MYFSPSRLVWRTSSSTLAGQLDVLAHQEGHPGVPADALDVGDLADDRVVGHHLGARHHVEGVGEVGGHLDRVAPADLVLPGQRQVVGAVELAAGGQQRGHDQQHDVRRGATGEAAGSGLMAFPAFSASSRPPSEVTGAVPPSLIGAGSVGRSGSGWPPPCCDGGRDQGVEQLAVEGLVGRGEVRGVLDQVAQQGARGDHDRAGGCRPWCRGGSRSTWSCCRRRRSGCPGPAHRCGWRCSARPCAWPARRGSRSAGGRRSRPCPCCRGRSVRTVPTARASAASAAASSPRSPASSVETEVRSLMNPSTKLVVRGEGVVSCDMFWTESNSGPLLSPKVCTAWERLSASRCRAARCRAAPWCRR